MLYVTPAVELAAHERLICDEDTAVAVSEDGAEGGGGACVVALAMFEAADATPFATAVTVKE
jgi:hypothetical protein